MLPLERGIELEPDDLLRREIITLLMCHFRLDTRTLESKWEFSFSEHFRTELEQLQVMQSDGLLQLFPDRLEVKPAGRLLVRNICMVFDRYLKESGTSFSRVI
jgi:oxygen-independent coproporphyrinogen-3 oxidase